MTIAIVDYQMGNLRSVQKAFEKSGHSAIITSDATELSQASHLVLPGVGAFRDAIAEIRRRDLVGPIKQSIAEGKPFLGICLGLQLLFDVSYEDGEHEGLGILPGDVVKFQAKPGLKVPHMGWNQAAIRSRPPMWEGVNDNAYFYFVHSYYVRPSESSVCALETDYDGNFCSVAWKDNIVATQFHPEKSQRDGLRLLDNFARQTVACGR